VSEHIANILAAPTIQRTKLAAAALALLVQERRAVVTTYTLFLLLRRLFTPENRQKLYLRADTPTTGNLRKLTANLSDTGGIEVDSDYGRSVFRVLSVGESPADEVCPLANPFGYISHLSAMQRWGLTDRRPEALHLTMPPPSAVRPLIEQRMAADYNTPLSEIPLNEMVKLAFIRHPETVRGRKISVYETKHPGQWLQVRDSHARLATIGQTFVDTVERPQYCGGMAHVLDVWREHAGIYLQEVIATVDKVESPIVKVRAGYLLDDMMGLGNDLRVQGWVRFAQRGGARVLDPTKAFSPDHSAKWMLSINV
jgi:predicted transcriptional regulator of viral defense system